MARMLAASAKTYVGCCNRCARGKKRRHKPNAMMRHLGRAAEKRALRRAIERDF